MIDLKKKYDHRGNNIYLGNNSIGLINLTGNIETQLYNISKSDDGNTGRYTIGTSSLCNALDYITNMNESEQDSNIDKIKGFLICISAILQLNSDYSNQTLLENSNVMINDKFIIFRVINRLIF